MEAFGYELTSLGEDILKVTVPVVAGLLIWFIQTLAQRAWSEYETRRDIYRSVVEHIDALFAGGTPGDRREYLRTVRQVWLVGSDEVVAAANALSEAIRMSFVEDSLETRYREFIAAMRADLRTRRWLPPSGTKHGPNSFPIEGPGNV